MPRLLILCEYGALNGGERSMLATLPEVRAAGFEVLVLAPPKSPLADALRHRDLEVVASSIHKQTQRTSLSQRRENLADVIRQTRPQLVHANSLAMSRLAGPVVEHLAIPGIGHVRDIVGLSRAAVADVNRLNRLLAVSHATRDFHVAQGLCGETCHVLYNGVDLEQFRPRPATGYLHRALRLPAAARLVATIGQITPRKAPDVFLEAARRLAAEPDLAGVHFLHVGQRHGDKDEVVQLESQLVQAATFGPLAGRLHLLGRRDDVPALLGELTLLVHPARQEPLGRVLLEAAACGLAIIATDVGGAREIFPPPAAAAQLVAVDDPGALAASIDRLLRDQPKRAQLAVAARQRAEAAFDCDVRARQLVQHYRELTPGN